jgi:hypothetical protein
MKEDTNIPKLVSVVAITLGCFDLIRGFMHTIMLDYAATNIAGFDLSTSMAGDLLQQMGAFGISNYLTGIMLILIGWKARPLALTMLGVIPVAYAIGFSAIKINSAAYPPSQAARGGAKPMMVYLVICGISFVAGGWITQHRKKDE